MAREETQIYQIKVTLKGAKPPIWRRILVPGDTTLLKLHGILQIVMGWENYHLHLFTFDGEIYGDPADDQYGFMGTMPERNYRLSQLIHGEGQRFLYEYDFGDSWDHVLRVEKIGPRRAGVSYPTCIAGRRACPPEDVGGVWGYEDFLEAIRNPDHPEHEEYLEWAGDEFDPQEFDLEAINAELRTMGRGQSAQALDAWATHGPEPDADSVAQATHWVDNLPPAQRALTQALPLRRDVVTLLEYLRDNRVTGTKALGNLTLKAVAEICARFVDPPPLEEKIGDKVFAVRSESEVWPLYFRHVLVSVAGLIDGGPGRRWKLTKLGEEFLNASAPAQVWVLWATWWTTVNWGIASPHDFEEGQVPPWFIRQTLDHLLDLEPVEWVPFQGFADSLIQDAELIPPSEDPKEAARGLRHAVRRAVIGPLTDFGALEIQADPERTPGARFWLVSSFRVKPLGRGLLEATRRAIE